MCDAPSSYKRFPRNFRVISCPCRKFLSVLKNTIHFDIFQKLCQCFHKSSTSHGSLMLIGGCDLCKITNQKGLLHNSFLSPINYRWKHELCIASYYIQWDIFKNRHNRIRFITCEDEMIFQNGFVFRLIMESVMAWYAIFLIVGIIKMHTMYLCDAYDKKYIWINKPYISLFIHSLCNRSHKFTSCVTQEMNLWLRLHCQCACGSILKVEPLQWFHYCTRTQDINVLA